MSKLQRLATPHFLLSPALGNTILFFASMNSTFLDTSYKVDTHSVDLYVTDLFSSSTTP